MSNRFILLFLILWIGFCLLADTKLKEAKDKQEAWNIMEREMPQKKDFVFKKPEGWLGNFITGATIVAEGVTDKEKKALQAVIDGDLYSTWTSTHYKPAPVFTIQMNKMATFNRIVIANRFTEMRGTGGGHNALKEVEILAAKDNYTPFRSLGMFTLKGHREFCVKLKSGGQICTFVPRTQPDIIEIPITSAKRLKIICRSAYWGKTAPIEWQTSLALSEILLFHSGK